MTDRLALMREAPAVPAWRRWIGYAIGGLSLLGAVAGLIWAAIAIWWPILPTLLAATLIVWLIDRARACPRG